MVRVRAHRKRSSNRSYRGIPRRLRRKYASVRKPKGVPKFAARIRRLLWSWWFWAALAVVLGYQDAWELAILSACMAFLGHLTLPRELPPIFGLDHHFDVGSEEFLGTVMGATGVPFLGGNSLRIYNNGDEFYPAMLDAIAGAECTITIEAYIYWEGNIGRKFAEALAEKARAGSKVKILLDAVGSATIGENILAILKGGGCQIAWFNPIFWYTIGRFNNRTHRKSLIVDGRIAFTGGAGIADHWLGDAQDAHHWRDIQVRLEGPGVLPLQSGFAQNWLETTGELVTGSEFYPPAAPAGDIDLQTILSSPQTGASAVRTMYYLSIVCARRSLYIANPYFIPDQVAIEILVDARKRGVDVKILVSGRHNDSRLARRNSTRLYGELLRAGIEIYEYNRTMLHHKILIADGIWATVGTTNFDNRSFAHNEENNVCFYDPALVAGLGETFLRDLAVSDRVHFRSWRKRSPWIRLQEATVSLLQDQV